MTGPPDRPCYVLPDDFAVDADSLAEKSLRIATADELRRLSNSSLVAVRHAIPHRIDDTDLLWDLGPSLSRPDELLSARDLLVDRLIDTGWQINSCVALSAPASALTTLLATCARLMNPSTARVHYWDNYSGSLSTDRFELHERILLVDTLVRTGLHLATAYEYIEGRGGQITGVVTLCLGASEQSDVDEMHPRVSDLLSRNKLVYVYSWGQLRRYGSRPEVRSKLVSKMKDDSTASARHDDR